MLKLISVENDKQREYLWANGEGLRVEVKQKGQQGLMKSCEQCNLVKKRTICNRHGRTGKNEAKGSREATRF